MMVMALAILKVEQETADLADVGAHQLRMAKKDFVGAAIRVYLQLRKEEIEASMRAQMAKLDGSTRTELSLLTGISPEDIDRLGGTSGHE
jgi:hypothetical protein